MVMGEHVKLASRLEGLTKEYATHILVTEQTLIAARKGLNDEGAYTVRELDAVRVVGKQEPVRLFELRRRGTATTEEMPLLDGYARALALYRARQFAEARLLFESLLKRFAGESHSALEQARRRPFPGGRTGQGDVRHPVRQGEHHQDRAGKREDSRYLGRRRILRRDEHPQQQAALGRRGGGRGREAPGDRSEDVRGDDPRQCRNRGAPDQKAFRSIAGSRRTDREPPLARPEQPRRALPLASGGQTGEGDPAGQARERQSQRAARAHGRERARGPGGGEQDCQGANHRAGAGGRARARYRQDAEIPGVSRDERAFRGLGGLR